MNVIEMRMEEDERCLQEPEIFRGWRSLKERNVIEMRMEEDERCLQDGRREE